MYTSSAMKNRPKYSVLLTMPWNMPRITPTTSPTATSWRKLPVPVSAATAFRIWVRKAASPME